MKLIEAIDVGKTYPDGTEALQGVTFSVQKGEFISIMGPSGSGKSTLLHVLGLLDVNSSGTYLFQGKDIREYEDDELARIRNEEMGFVFQSFNLLPRSTVFENVMLPFLYSSIPEEEWEAKAVEAIRSVGLAHRITFDVSKLSGGERQRVAIARALVLSPGILFADEPTGNLDTKSGQQVMDILGRLHSEKGHTVVLITHDIHTAEYAEKILYVRDGRLEKEEQVLNRRALNSI
jgi:putative ABC transport system ATP-binding protein